jgi:hypothetical protein
MANTWLLTLQPINKMFWQEEEVGRSIFKMIGGVTGSISNFNSGLVSITSDFFPSILKYWCKLKKKKKKKRFSRKK